MIYVNARFLTQELTGVQRFAEEICLKLKEIREDIVFVSPFNIKSKKVAEQLNVQIIGTSTGHRWEQTELPKFLKSVNNPLLINLSNTAPLLYKNKIVTHHDVTYKKYPQSYSRKFRLFYNLFIPVMLKTSKTLITVSEFSKKEICDVYNYSKNNTHVIYNAASTIFKPLEDKKVNDERYLLAVSSPNYHKNFHGLLDAFLSIEGLDDVKLKIIGASNKNFAGYDYNQKFNDSQGRVEFLGRVSDDELVSLYNGALAFAFPSFYEGFGIPPVEAQASGCPVISSNKASMPEVLLDSAIYFDPGSKDEIQSAIIKMVSDVEIRNEYISKGLLNSKRFLWESSANKLNDIINSLPKQ